MRKFSFRGMLYVHCSILFQYCYGRYGLFYGSIIYIYKSCISLYFFVISAFIFLKKSWRKIKKYLWRSLMTFLAFKNLSLQLCEKLQLEFIFNTSFLHYVLISYVNLLQQQNHRLVNSLQKDNNVSFRYLRHRGMF
jgi:hypothetical protein